MDAQKAQLLIDALRSGKFQQTTGRLRMEDSFCCLGVACEVYREQTGFGQWVASVESNQYFLGQSSSLPEPVMAWFGFQTVDGFLDNTKASLIAHNDNDHYTFAQIADVIEQNVERL